DNSADFIADFTDNEDRIDLTAFPNLSFTDLAISAEAVDAIIDITPHNGGRIILRKFNPADLDATDFIFAR
ncbi:MAG: hypothetical protein OXE97_01420, partial [Gammaproteobacteria bacterium]|nr:hypothetical protein [Gammaproteobacteria bacterium]